MRSADRFDVGAVGNEDAGADHVVPACPSLCECREDDLKAAQRLNTGVGFARSIGQIGAAPDTTTRSSTRTAQLNPIEASYGEPEEICCRSMVIARACRTHRVVGSDNAMTLGAALPLCAVACSSEVEARPSASMTRA